MRSWRKGERGRDGGGDREGEKCLLFFTGFCWPRRPASHAFGDWRLLGCVGCGGARAHIDPIQGRETGVEWLDCGGGGGGGSGSGGHGAMGGSVPIAFGVCERYIRTLSGACVFRDPEFFLPLYPRACFDGPTDVQTAHDSMHR
jgi:hypothetical protein